MPVSAGTTSNDSSFTTGKAAIGLGGGAKAGVAFATVAALVKRSAGAEIRRPSKFVSVLYTWKLSALYM